MKKKPSELSNQSKEAKQIELAILEKYPHLLAAKYSLDKLLFPEKIKDLFYYVYNKAKNKELIRIIVKAPRGGGKSRVLASLELALWYLLKFDVVNLGGSFKQASKVYSYLTPAFMSEFMKEDIQKTIQIETKSKLGNSIYVLAATEKQTRSPHVGSQDRGGALVIDEECEADDDIVNSAIPVVNTANPSIIIRSSTFHKSFGSFQECWDNANDMGYKQFQWDIFDVSEKCNDVCDDVYDQVDGKNKPCILLDYCKGKAHFSNGWVKIQEIRQQRREVSHNQFMVELMGGRPSADGLVYSPVATSRAVVQNDFTYQTGMPSSVGLDWGWAGETAIIWTQMQRSQSKNKFVIRVLDAQKYNKPEIENICDIVKHMTQNWELCVYPDGSGQSGFQNYELQKRGALMFPVSFVKLKDYGISNITKLLEQDRLEIPDKFSWLVDQMKKYRMGENGKPVKKNDHGPDALLCSCLHYTDKGFGSSGFLESSAQIEVGDPYKNKRGLKTGYQI